MCVCFVFIVVGCHTDGSRDHALVHFQVSNTSVVFCLYCAKAREHPKLNAFLLKELTD